MHGGSQHLTAGPISSGMLKLFPGVVETSEGTTWFSSGSIGSISLALVCPSASNFLDIVVSMVLAGLKGVSVKDSEIPLL